MKDVRLVPLICSSVMEETIGFTAPLALLRFWDFNEKGQFYKMMNVLGKN